MCEIPMYAQIDLAATTGYKDFIFGGEATFDSAKQDVTKWTAGVGVYLPSFLDSTLRCKMPGTSA